MTDQFIVSHTYHAATQNVEMTSTFPSGDKTLETIKMPEYLYHYCQEVGRYAASSLVSAGQIKPDSANPDASNIATAMTTALLRLHAYGMDVATLCSNQQSFDKLVAVCVENQALWNYPLTRKIEAEMLPLSARTPAPELQPPAAAARS